MTQEQPRGRDAEGKVWSQVVQSFHTLSGFTILEALQTPSFRGSYFHYIGYNRLSHWLLATELALQPCFPPWRSGSRAEGSSPLTMWLLLLATIPPLELSRAPEVTPSVHNQVWWKGAVTITTHDPYHLGNFKGFKSSVSGT